MKLSIPSSMRFESHFRKCISEDVFQFQTFFNRNEPSSIVIFSHTFGQNTADSSGNAILNPKRDVWLNHDSMCLLCISYLRKTANVRAEHLGTCTPENLGSHLRSVQEVLDLWREACALLAYVRPLLRTHQWFGFSKNQHFIHLILCGHTLLMQIGWVASISLSCCHPRCGSFWQCGRF